MGPKKDKAGEGVAGETGDLAGRAAWGILWAFLGTGATRLVSLAATMVLARLLAPEAFGLVAFALVVLAWAETVGDLGTGMALIYWPRRRSDAAQATFLINLLMGAFWFGVVWLSAPGIAAFLERPDGAPVLRLLAWSFPLRFLGTTHEALAKKDLRFKALMAPQAGLAVLKAVVAILLALRGYGVWSLVAGHLAGLAAWTVLLWAVVPWRPRWKAPRDLFLPMLRYGRGLVAVNVIAAVVHHIDFVIVGKMLGMAALGFYQIAYKIPDMTVTMLLRTVSKVVYPAYAAVHAGRKSLEAPYLATLRYVSLLTLPAAAGMILLAEPIVVVLFGERWRPSIPILQALATYAALRSLGTHAGDVLKATARTGLLAGLALVKAAVIVPVLLLAGGISAAAVAWTLAGATVITLGLNLWVAARILGLGTADLVRAVRPGALGTALMAAVLLAMRLLPGPLQAGLPGLLVAVAAGAGVYLAYVLVVAPEVVEGARHALGGGRHRGEGT